MQRMALSQITWQDVQQMPEDGRRYEAIEGDLYVTAAPVLRHQRVGFRIGMALHNLVEVAGHGIVFGRDVGVEFPMSEEGVIPDVVAVSNSRRGIVAQDWLHGAPDLVVEVLSPSTAHRDRGIKLRLYKRQGVAEYWVVDHEARSVEVWRFGSDPDHERFTDRLSVRLGEETLGEIDLAEIFRDD